MLSALLASGLWLVGSSFFFFFSKAVAGSVGLLGREERELCLVVAHGGNYWLNHGVLAMAVVLVACHGDHGFDSEMGGWAWRRQRRRQRRRLWC